jgi:VWFA-related protein
MGAVRMMRAFGMAGAVLVGAMLAAVAAAQDQAQTPQQNPITTLKTGTALVLVPALVTTKDGKPVFTLTADDFKLTDDGVPQTLRLEEDADQRPLALVVLVESGGDGAKHLGEYRGLQTEIETVLGDVEHTVAVVDFDSEPEILQPFTTKMDNVGSALEKLEAGDDGAAQLDALKFSVDMLRKQPPRYRRAILMFSETHDHGSHTTVSEAVRAVSDTNTAIYSFGFSSVGGDTRRASGALPPQLGGNDDPGPSGGCFSRKPDADGNPPKKNAAEQDFDCVSLLAPPLALAKMAVVAAISSMHRDVPETVAKLTGGEYFGFKDEKSLVRGLHELSNHMPNRYMLSFVPQSPHAGFHALTLTTNRQGVYLKARTSYWAETVADAAK